MTKLNPQRLNPLASIVVSIALLTGFSSPAWTQAIGGAELAKPVAGDPGISSMVVSDTTEYIVLRDYAEPGATRRMHRHSGASWHVFTLLTGKLVLTIKGKAPMEVTPGQVVTLEGGVSHTFTNTSTVTATIVEVFGKLQPLDAFK